MSSAVFLSYASQDAEAAKRICEALRAAGVEVWFDQNELVGGDAWDAKIRKQIKDCTLFVPVISAATQARAEGYFRLEWKLAVDRSHLMADDAPFLFPVVIDDTADAAARVPDKFREVQWTRLNVKDMPESLAARVGKLLSKAHADTAGDDRDEAVRGRGRKRERKPAWMRYTTSLIGLTIGLVYAIRGGREHTSEKNEIRSDQTVATSEAKQLVAKAWVLLNKPSMARAELAAADELCKRAAALALDDAEVWAAWSSVHTWYIFQNFDVSPARHAAARDASSRAMQLAPESYEARLAQALYWGRGESATVLLDDDREKPQQREAEELLARLLVERPDEPRALYNLGYFYSRGDRVKKGLELLERVAANPAFAALAWDEIGWYYYWTEKDYRQAEKAVNRSLAAEPFWDNLALKIRIQAEWYGDLDGTKSTLQRMSASALQEDWGVALTVRVYDWRRESQEIIRLLERVPTEWLSSNLYEGPKALLLGEARKAAGQPEAARLDLEQALAQVNQRLATTPNDWRLLDLKVTALVGLDKKDEAARALRAYRELKPGSNFDLDLLLATPDEAVARVEEQLTRTDTRLTAAALRHDPAFDSIRQHPRFPELLRRAESDLRRSPAAKAAQR